MVQEKIDNIRKERVLSKGRKGGYPQHVIFFDTETRWKVLENEHQLHTLRLGWSCYVNYRNKKTAKRREDWLYYTTINKFNRWLLSKTKPKRTLYVIASNVWFDVRVTSVDFYLFSKGFVCTSLYSRNFVTIMEFTNDNRKVVFLSTQNFLGLSVEKIGKLLDIPKYEVNFETATEEQLKEHCRIDTLIIKTAFGRWLDYTQRTNMGRFRNTRASQALTAYRSRFMPYNIYIHSNNKAIELERDSYFGGRTECFYIGTLKKRNIYKLDINSQYPSVMSKYKYPVRLIWYGKCSSVKRLAEHLKQYAVTARIYARVKEPIIPKRIDGHTCFPIGEFDCVVSTEALKRLLKTNSIIGVSEIAVYDTAPIFKNYMAFFNKEKEQFSQAEDTFGREMAKYFMNTFYGKWAQHKETVVYVEEANPYKVETEITHNLDNGYRGRIVTYGGLTTYYEDRGEIAANSFVTIASHVTEYARFLLWDYMKIAGRKNVYYCDTDSLFVNATGYRKLKRYIHPDKLGMLKVEAKTRECIIHGNKDYIFGTEVKCKGIRKDAEEIGKREYKQQYFPTLATFLREPITEGYTVKTIVKVLSGEYTKGIVLNSGFIIPYTITEGDITTISPLDDLPF